MCNQEVAHGLECRPHPHEREGLGHPGQEHRLTEYTALTRQAVTKHLRVLADAGLASHAKVGRERLWEFRPQRLDEARRSLEASAAHWDRALERLRAAVER